MIRVFGLAACLAIGGGCIHVHTDADGRLKSVTVGDPVNAKPAEGMVDPNVRQASAKLPASTIASIAKATTKDLPKGAAAEIFVAWQNKVAQLPDPTRNGALIHGVVGQMFLFTSDFKAAEGNGQLVVEMFDISRPDSGEGTKLGLWTFDKDTLKRLATMDERFGKCYALFLPWPEYNPQVGRVRLKVRFDPERGYPLFAKETPLTLDNEYTAAFHRQSSSSAGASVAGFGGVTPSAATAPPRPLPPLDPLPVGGRNAPVGPASASGANPLPPNLPSLIIPAGPR